MQNFRALGAPPPDPQIPAAGGFAPRPSQQPPIANFWPRACRAPCFPATLMRLEKFFHRLKQNQLYVYNGILIS